MMGIAQSVIDVRQGVIRLPVVVNDGADDVCQHGAALVTGAIEGQQSG
jgi:hypothetical protein